MKMQAILKYAAIPVGLALLMVSLEAHAAIDSTNVLDDILGRYLEVGSAWTDKIQDYASWLFWSLSLMSIVITFGFMAVRQADFGELFAEIIRYMLFTGFFYWLLINGPGFSLDIINSLKQIGSDVTGTGNGLSPNGILNIGFKIFFNVLDQSGSVGWTDVDSMTGILMALITLISLALVGVNIVMLLVSAWVLAYGGVFLLGFGGSRWTSDIAINYYKSVLGVAASLLAIILLLSIGNSFLAKYSNDMSLTISLKELAVMMVVALVMLVLLNKIPALISSIVTGSRVGGALNVTGMVASAAATGGAAIGMGAAHAVANTQTLIATFSNASQNNGSTMYGQEDALQKTQTDANSRASGLASAMGTMSSNSMYTGNAITQMTGKESKAGASATDLPSPSNTTGNQTSISSANAPFSGPISSTSNGDADSIAGPSSQSAQLNNQSVGVDATANQSNKLIIGSSNSPQSVSGMVDVSNNALQIEKRSGISAGGSDGMHSTNAVSGSGAARNQASLANNMVDVNVQAGLHNGEAAAALSKSRDSTISGSNAQPDSGARSGAPKSESISTPLNIETVASARTVHHSVQGDTEEVQKQRGKTAQVDAEIASFRDGKKD